MGMVLAWVKSLGVRFYYKIVRKQVRSSWFGWLCGCGGVGMALFGMAWRDVVWRLVAWRGVVWCDRPGTTSEQ